MTWDDSKSLASILSSVQAQEREPDDTRPTLRISMLRNFTVESMLPLLKHCCYASGLQPDVVVGEYDNVLQEILDPQSHVYAPAPDLVVLNLLLEPLDPACLSVNWEPAAAQDAVLAMLAGLAERSRALVVVNTLLPPLACEDSLGAATRPHHRVQKVEAINAAIRDFARQHAGRIFVIDSARIVQQVGEDRALDPRYWYLYRAPFKRDFLGRYADQIVRIGRALKGRARKCLVLDCDNTLWGGVVGEDGLEGIALDPHEYPGRCFHDFQRSVLNLIEQGVVVALCSKNNEADVLEVLDHHPHSLLRRQHLAAWRIDWGHKPQNIASLASELNLGLDSMVFVDDSAMECGAVREALPDVAVLQVPTEPADLPRLLYRGGWFDRLSESAEDADRNAMYVVERQRTGLMKQAASVEDYLASLSLRATIRRATNKEIPRVAQLLSKTNQFNLTTRRHSVAQVRAWSEQPDHAIFTLSAQDKLGDLGLVGVLIARRDGDVGEIDSLLISCRALGRKLEWVFADECLNALERDWPISTWRACYIPTARNQQVRDFWSGVGFETAQSTTQVTHYTGQRGTHRPHGISFIEIKGN